MKFSQRMLITIALAFSLFPVTACQTAPPAPPPPEERTVSLEEFFTPPSDKVANNADSIVVKGVRTKTIKGVIKAADFKLYNNRGGRNVVNYRVQWLDKDGLMASPYDPWATIDLEGQQELIVTAISPTNKAVDYRLELKTN